MLKNCRKINIFIFVQMMIFEEINDLFEITCIEKNLNYILNLN
jgi:hypothetical protein